MKKLLVSGLILAMGLSLFGCGSSTESATAETQEAEAVTEEAATEEVADAATEETTEEVAEEEAFGDDEEMGDYPDNWLEERLNQFSFSSTDEIIGDLEAGEAYAYIDVMGSDEPILVIAQETFDGNGYPQAIECYPYLLGNDGTYSCAGSLLYSDSTATPVAVSDDGVVFCAGHTQMNEYVIGDGDIPGFMELEYVYTILGDDGMPSTYGGFIRSTNSVAEDGEQIAEDDAEAFEQAFADYEEATPIEFTLVE